MSGFTTAQLVSNENGDWQALYINGMKYKEGHSIDARDVLEALKGHIVIKPEIETEDDEMGGHYPHKIEDLDPDIIINR